ncbi:MAG: DUF4846 domain-containing protein [Flavobacteriales bacterium]
MRTIIIGVLLFGMFSCDSNTETKVIKPNVVVNTIRNTASLLASKTVKQDTSKYTIEGRIHTPEGFARTKEKTASFELYLRQLQLKKTGSEVLYFDGTTKENYGVYHSVVDLPIGRKDLHQCADAVMRLKAEYLWRNKKYNQIHFNLTNGFRVNYSEWMKGKRVVVKDNKTYWNNRNMPSNTYADFWKYMEFIFTYAGTASLDKELSSVSTNEAKIGDVLIQGGFPGHAIIIVDKAINKKGHAVYLLAQSYMPAQEIQVLNNTGDYDISPWFSFKDTDRIITPEWQFTSQDLKRFRD